MLGALCAATWKYCKSQLPFVKPSVLLNVLVVVPCAYMLWLSTGLWEMRFICCSFSVGSASPLSHLCLSQLHHLAGLGRTETPNSCRSPVTCRQQMHYKTSSVLGCLILFLYLWCSRSPSYFCPLCIIVTTEMQHLWHPRMIFCFFKDHVNHRTPGRSPPVACLQPGCSPYSAACLVVFFFWFFAYT